ncbi:MAG: type 1 glutamine amidotransferase domain-containing protein, partial [Cyclobacteriaceae bacterium]
VIPYRGKILAVVTSADLMGSSGKSTGYELTELSRAYYVFQANGFEVDVASPLGGLPPVVIDGDDMKEYDYAFLNDSDAQAKVKNSIAMADVEPDAYEAVYFVGGKGAMFDFPENKHIQSLVSAYYESGKVVSAVCHGPAALVNVKLSDGSSLLANKTVSSFTNAEELFLIPDAPQIFPFLLQDKLTENGARFNEGFLYLNTVSKDGNLVTGQNPWSTWEVAESVIAQLGYAPKPRFITREENSISVLGTFEAEGYSKAKSTIDQFCTEDALSIDREIIAVHSIVAAMQFELGKTINLIRLLSYSNGYL